MCRNSNIFDVSKTIKFIWSIDGVNVPFTKTGTGIAVLSTVSNKYSFIVLSEPSSSSKPMVKPLTP